MVSNTPAFASSDLIVGRELTDDSLSRALLIRAVEQRLLRLFSEGKLFGTVHTCIGQEWSAVAVMESLRPGDLIFSNHRCHGHYLAWTDDADGLIGEVMGRVNGMCGGRGGSQHICTRGFFSNGIQGGIVPVATGLALSQKLRGKGNLSAVFIGDGTLGEGAVYEAANIASKWDLPLLIVMENNGYSQSTSQSQTLAGEIDARFAAFEIETAHGKTSDPVALLRKAAQAVARVRQTGRPLFFRIDTYRLMAHSKGDDDRDPAEVKYHWSVDPLERFRIDQPERAERLQSEVDRRVNDAVRTAEASAMASPVAVGNQTPEPLRWHRFTLAKSDRFVNLLHAALQTRMQVDDRILLLGEDIEGPYGGAFKVTKNLSLEFPGRVRNTPISESAIVGTGIGLALEGWLPICEVMFGDFLALAFDQLLNHASKFRYTYNDQVTVPLVVRTPMGGRRGYGATHSQSIEKHFLGMADTRVLAMNHRIDPATIYDNLYPDVGIPTLIIENKLLYGAKVADWAPAGFAIEHSNERFSTVRIRPHGTPDVTLLCYGGMLPEAEKAAEILFEDHDIIVEIICPTQLYPLRLDAISQSIAVSGRLLIAEEGPTFAAFGAEVAARLLESNHAKPPKLRRVGPPDHPIPSCGTLERELLPGFESIVRAAREIVGHV